MPINKAEYLTAAFLPPRSSSLRCNLRAFSLRHGLETALTADLTALAPYRRHVGGEVRGGSCRRRSSDRFRPFHLASRAVYNPLGKLVWIAGTFSFSYRHFCRSAASCNTAASIRSMCMIVVPPISWAQSRPGLALQRGHMADIGLVGSSPV